MFNFDAHWDPIDLEELMRTVQKALKNKYHDQQEQQQDQVEPFNLGLEQRPIEPPKFFEEELFGEEDEPNPNVLEDVLNMLEDALFGDEDPQEEIRDLGDLDTPPIATTKVWFKGRIYACDVINETYCIYPYEQWEDLELIN